MSTTMTIQNIAGVENQEFEPGTYSSGFSCVTVADGMGGEVKLFLPFGTGQAVADAINAAVATSAAHADEVAA